MPASSGSPPCPTLGSSDCCLLRGRRPQKATGGELHNSSSLPALLVTGESGCIAGGAELLAVERRWVHSIALPTFSGRHWS